MAKYYRVIKENFLWEEGAILQYDQSYSGYSPIDNLNIWDKTTHVDDEYVTDSIVENSPEYFERVYPSKADKALFVTGDVLKKAYEKMTT